jgi:hypothetical protein
MLVLGYVCYTGCRNCCNFFAYSIFFYYYWWGGTKSLGTAATSGLFSKAYLSLVLSLSFLLPVGLQFIAY